MVSPDHIKQELLAQFSTATARGAKHILINAGELTLAASHAAVVADPLYCVEVMRETMKAGDEIVRIATAANLGGA